MKLSGNRNTGNYQDVGSIRGFAENKEDMVMCGWDNGYKENKK